MAIKGVNKPSNTDIYVFFSVFFHFTKISVPIFTLFGLSGNRGVRRIIQSTKNTK